MENYHQLISMTFPFISNDWEHTMQKKWNADDDDDEKSTQLFL